MAAPVNDGSPPLPSLETALALLHEKMPNYVPQNIYLFGMRFSYDGFVVFHFVLFVLDLWPVLSSLCTPSYVF
jgi:hypothetical protein